MSVLDELVTDRTQADVDALNDKGTYNAADLNRVGEAVSLLAAGLESMGMSAPVAPVTDWTDGGVPNAEQMSVYLRDVTTIQTRLQALTGEAPQIPASMEGLTYTGANAIEETLVLMAGTLDDMEAAAELRQADTIFMESGGLFNAG